MDTFGEAGNSEPFLIGARMMRPRLAGAGAISADLFSTPNLI
jgi:hypothetical protein